MKIKKAVFPVAGLGTRFLPATKATPKEMLPIVDKPLIQYAVEEAIAAGFTEMLFITNHNKRPIEDHFDYDISLAAKLATQGKEELLAVVKNILPANIACAYIRQSEALGLGHAVLCAEPFINDEPFAVILADDLILTQEKNCLQKMLEAYQKTQHSILAVEQIPLEKSSQYGVIMPANDPEHSGIINVKNIVEKPAPANAPSNLGVVGRYILTPDIFKYLKTMKRGTGNEYQLTDGIAEMLHHESVSAIEIPGCRFDCGSKLGYLEATVAYALEHKDLKKEFSVVLEKYR